MIATEPLPQALWDDIGLRDRETFADFRHLVIYGQRTADNRLVFGGRGAPYHFGSKTATSYDQAPKVFHALRATLTELLPATRQRRSPIDGADHSASRGTGMPRLASITPPASAGLAATSAMGSPRPTLPDEP